MSENFSSFFFSAIWIGLPLFYLVCQARALNRWEGTIRKIAWLPVGLWALWVLKFTFDISRDPTSHSLFPFEIIMGTIAALLFLTVLSLLRRLLV